MNTQEELKKAVGKKAASFVEAGMLVGLGTGSTAFYFIETLIERCRTGLSITAVSSSIHSLKQAEAGGIPIINMDEVTSIDLTVDGADEVDRNFRLIKGGGGALLREKVIAATSKQMIVIVDESKLVDVLGRFGLPIEIIPFGYRATIAKINQLGYHGKQRQQNEGSPYITDNGNYIYDVHDPNQFPNPEMDHDRMINVPGVVETGLFFHLPIHVLVGWKDGSVKFAN